MAATKRKRATTTPPSITALKVRGRADRAKDYAAAGVEYDPRLASARRDLKLENLGASNRVRSLEYARLFVQATATPLRVAACAAFDNLWHNAHRGDYPEPKFESSGGNKSTSAPHPEFRAGAKIRLSRLKQRLTPLHYGILEGRVIDGFSFRYLSTTVGVSHARIHEIFAVAADQVADALGLVNDETNSRIRSWVQQEHGDGLDHKV
jgi:hypothetical protein